MSENELPNTMTVKIDRSLEVEKERKEKEKIQSELEELKRKELSRKPATLSIKHQQRTIDRIAEQ